LAIFRLAEAISAVSSVSAIANDLVVKTYPLF